MESPILPPPDDTLKAAYLKLIEDIDNLSESFLSKRLKDKLQCRPGCAACCISFSVLPLEAALVSERLREMYPLEIQKGATCPLLFKSLCLIYDTRPIICRTQGLPIAYIDEASSSIEVSACPLNFADDFEFDTDDLFFMDQFNRRLAELNLRYCHSAGLDPEKRIAFTDLTDPLG